LIGKFFFIIYFDRTDDLSGEREVKFAIAVNETRLVFEQDKGLFDRVNKEWRCIWNLTAYQYGFVRVSSAWLDWNRRKKGCCGLLAQKKSCRRLK
jgi:hypothetical protein